MFRRGRSYRKEHQELRGSWERRGGILQKADYKYRHAARKHLLTEQENEVAEAGIQHISLSLDVVQGVVHRQVDIQAGEGRGIKRFRRPSGRILYIK